MYSRTFFSKRIFPFHKINFASRSLATMTAAAGKINFELLNRTIESVSSLQRLQKKLNNNEKLIIKYGVDITAPFLHLGHAVNLWMLRHFQDCGHKVIFLLGDFTTKIADPTGRLSTRKEIPQADIDRNAESFIRQIAKIINTADPATFEVRRNSEWYGKMQLDEFMGLLKLVNHNQLIKRDMFQKRIQNEHEIHMHELIYPVLQGYDSVMLRSDLTIVGSDQLFNETMGSFLQEKLGATPQIVITTKITPGIDGKEKQSKSLGNYIGLEDSPREMFGKVMKIPDSLIIIYLTVYSDIALDVIAALETEITEQKCNPMQAKLFLAQALVCKYYNAAMADAERAWFIKTFSRRVTPTDVPVINISTKSGLDIMRFCLPDKSNAEYRRLIKQGAVYLQNKRINSEKELAQINNDDILLIGKRHWFKLTR